MPPSYHTYQEFQCPTVLPIQTRTPVCYARRVSRGPVDLCSDTTEGRFSVPRSQEVQWTLALVRPRGALASREIEPKLRSSWVSRSAPHFSDNKKGLPIRKSFLLSHRARDGDRTRDPLLGKEVLHH